MKKKDHEKAKRLAGRALIYAIMGEREQLAKPLESIVNMSPEAVHGILCGWSGLTLSMFEAEQGPKGDGEFWALEVEDIETRESRSLDGAGRATADALRFMSCFGNRDYPTTTAILDAAYDDPKALADLLWVSVHLAADAAKVMKAKRDAA